ncbi:MAG TPA: hypothetical protein ENF23_01400 [Methanosarcinales archaeon]|nr:MAG: hypothetical protein DRO03_06760 [Methanosarcinales archaeon]HDN64946.1 hypothetical protein [Methanosarcinales archaeon]
MGLEVIALTTAQIGTLFSATGRYREALQNFMTAAAIFEKLGSPYLKTVLNCIDTIKQELDEEQFSQYLRNFSDLYNHPHHP